jgi:hypothetical protein
MNRIVFEHYPASKLPDDMRAKVDPDATVTVVLTVEDQPPEKVMTLEEIFAGRRPPFRTVQEIDDDLRRDRDAWGD